MHRRASVQRFFEELGREIWQVSYTLFKVMIPALIVVKLLEELGAVDYLALLLGPVMGWLGLPDAMGLVWATTLLTNIYTGMLVFFQLEPAEPLTVAQITVLGSLLLMAHNLPVETRIAQQAGIRVRVTLLLRIGGGLLFGWMLHRLYSDGEWLQTVNVVVWRPQPVDESLWGWLVSQGKSLAMIQLIIIALLTLLKLLKVAGIERLLVWLLRPLLKLLSIGPQATTITIVGLTLGLSYGGGLLIREVRQGHISKQDVFAAICFLSLCHGIIEDTLLIMLLGADGFGILWLRLLFSIMLIAMVTRVLNSRPDWFWQRFLVNRCLCIKNGSSEELVGGN